MLYQYIIKSTVRTSKWTTNRSSFFLSSPCLTVQRFEQYLPRLTLIKRDHFLWIQGHVAKWFEPVPHWHCVATVRSYLTAKWKRRQIGEAVKSTALTETRMSINHFSIISLVNNGFQAFWLVAWPVNMRHYLLVGIFSKWLPTRVVLMYYTFAKISR